MSGNSVQFRDKNRDLGIPVATAAELAQLTDVPLPTDTDRLNNWLALQQAEVAAAPPPPPEVPFSPETARVRLETDVSGARNSPGPDRSGYTGPSNIWAESKPPLLFPLDLISTTSQKFPFIGFFARKGAIGERSVFLPVPPGISFSDQMQYSSIDLGIIGKVVAGATSAAVNGGGVLSGAGGALGAAAGTVVNQIKSANAAAVASLATKKMGLDNVSSFIDFGAKQVVSPNTNTAFQNSGIRQFQFSFKMMPRDRAEANTITEILKRFRENMYPMANELILTYPPIWNIHFYDGARTELSDSAPASPRLTAAENTKLPGIHDCYLIAMNAVYNSSSNMFHEDGHPIETDVQLTFEETRALTLTDIVNLSENRKLSRF